MTGVLIRQPREDKSMQGACQVARKEAIGFTQLQITKSWEERKNLLAGLKGISVLPTP